MATSKSKIRKHFQGRNEVCGIRDQRPKKGWDQGTQPRIRDQSPRDRDQRVFHGLKDQASRFCGIRDQNFHHFWDQGLKICVKIRDQRRKNIPRYDPDIFVVVVFFFLTLVKSGRNLFLFLLKIRLIKTITSFIGVIFL